MTSPAQQSHSNTAKLNQVIQVVTLSRVTTTPAHVKDRSPKLNKWFNLELPEIDLFREDLKLWKKIDPGGAKVPPLLIETFLDIRHLSSHDSLVLYDEKSKNSYTITRSSSKSEIVLERWMVELDTSECQQSSESSVERVTLEDLPSIYKKAIVIIRSLYTHTQVIPAWTLCKNLSGPVNNLSPLRVGCRILNGDYPISSKGRFGLTRSFSTPTENESHLSSFSFTRLSTPLGTLRIQVTYRVQCDFRIHEHEDSLPDYECTSSSAHNKLNMSCHENPEAFNALGNPSTPSSGSFASRRRPSINSRVSGRSIDSQIGISSSPGPAGKLAGAGSGSNPAAVNIPVSNAAKYTCHPFKSPSLSGSPSSNLDSNAYFTQQPSVAAGSSPGVTRISSTSSFAALRMPRRSSSISNASSSSLLRVVTGVDNTTNESPQPLGYAHGTAATPHDPSMASPGPIQPNTMRQASSFGNRPLSLHGSPRWLPSAIPRSAASSSSANSFPHHITQLNAPEEITSSISSSGATSIEPCSGLYVVDEDLGEFVRIVDATKLRATHASNDSMCNTDMESSEPSSAVQGINSLFRPTSTHGISNQSSLSETALTRFQALQSEFSALSESLQSSVFLSKNEPQVDSITTKSTCTNPSSMPTSTELALMPNHTTPRQAFTYSPSIVSKLIKRYASPVDDEKSSSREILTRVRRASQLPKYSSASASFHNLPPHSIGISHTSPLDIPEFYARSNVYTRGSRSRPGSVVYATGSNDDHRTSEPATATDVKSSDDVIFPLDATGLDLEGSHLRKNISVESVIDPCDAKSESSNRFHSEEASNRVIASDQKQISDEEELVFAMSDMMSEKHI